jgi:hypothetical protein
MSEDLIPEGRYIDDPITTHVTAEYRKAEQRVVYNVAQGNWDRAGRWAQWLWAISEAAQGVVWEREDA